MTAAAGAAVAASAARDCRPGCGACCIAPSISSPIPGMPQGKPAGVRCVQLTDDHCCAIFGSPQRPACCTGLVPSDEMCGDSREQAIAWLAALEDATHPSAAVAAPVQCAISTGTGVVRSIVRVAPPSTSSRKRA